MHGILVHVETSPLHLQKFEWQGDTRPETKVNRCTKVDCCTKVYHCTKVTNSMDHEKLIVCQLVNLLTPNVNYSGRTAPLTSKVAFYIFIQQIKVLNILNMVYNLHFFSSKCSLFHNSNIFGSRIIHILYTGCAKIKKIILVPKG